MTLRRDPAAAAPSPSHWPLLIVVLGVAIGVVVAFLGDNTWRLGALVIGASMEIGALERIALPNRRAGLLQVRSKAFDVAVLALTGAAIIVLALIVPEGR